MRKLLLVPALALCAQSAIFEIISGTAIPGSGLSGSAAYQNNAAIAFTLEQYDLEDMALPNTGLPVYFRYTYAFSGAQSFDQLILGVSESCSGDAECIFGLQTTEGTAGDFRVYTEDDVVDNPGLGDPLNGLGISNFSPGVTAFTLSFFSNRVPGAGSKLYMRGGSEYLASDLAAVPTPDFPAIPQTEPPVHTPEPVSAALFGGGLLAFACIHRFRSRS